MDIPIDKNTIPHAAIREVIDWLGVGYQTTVKRRSDGAKIVIRISTEDDAAKKSESLKEAWTIINTLNMGELDQGESWARANFWLRDNEKHAPKGIRR